jgi:RND family efflux transporter MFP subunit
MPPTTPLLLVLPLLLGGCFERTQASVADAPRPVLAVHALPAPDAAGRAYAGLVKPRREADLGFRAGGRIIARTVDLGARVTQGALLAQLDPTDLALSLRSAEADLASAEAAAAQTDADARRSRILLAQGWTPAATDEQKHSAARQAAEKVRSARASLELARNKLAYADLRAPADGIVTAVLADPGTVVTEGQAVLRLADANALEIEVALPETALASAATAAVSAAAWAHPDIPLAATLRETAGAATSGLRTFAARFALSDPPAWLAIGMSATVTLAPPRAETLAALPATAVGDRGAGPMVWVIDSDAGTLAARPIRIAQRDPARVLVAGLAPGELVVRTGVQKLDPASRIRVADPAGE